MWRALVFIGLLCVAAFGAVWLADRPGTVVVTFAGYAVETSVSVAAIALIGLAIALALMWAAVSGLLNLPTRLTFASRARRRARGYQAVSRGMVAVGAGDPVAARRYANEAQRLLGPEPLTLLLKAQAAQVSGNRQAAEQAFTEMMEEDETRVLGLRGLFVEARRRGDPVAAPGYAAEAARLAPAATWAERGGARSACAPSATGAARSRRWSVGRPWASSTRPRPSASGRSCWPPRPSSGSNGTGRVALSDAQDAVKLAPDLVPAAALAGKLLSDKGDLRRGARIVEAAWRSQPHPDLAEVYVNLRPGDSALDRLKRAETLQRLSGGAPEGRLAVARAALEAREFGRARAALEPLLAERPTMRVCLLMSDLEQAEHGATGRGREWLARATRAPRDPVWIADGVVSDRWAPVSPVTGRIDAFTWQAPPDVLVAPELAMRDDVTGDLDDAPRAMIPMARPPWPPSLPRIRRPPPQTFAPKADPEPSPPVSPPAPLPVIVADEDAIPPKGPIEAVADPGPGPGTARPPDPIAYDERQEIIRNAMAGPEEPPDSPLPDRTSQAAPLTAPLATPLGSPRPEPVVFPLEQPPDDPGPKPAHVERGRFW